MNKICQILGTPTTQDWPDCERLAERRKYKFPQHSKKNLAELIPHASKSAISLMEWMLQFNYKKRPTAEQILKHSFFTEKIDPIDM